MNIKVEKPVKLRGVQVPKHLIERNVKDRGDFGVWICNMSKVFVVHGVAFTSQIPDDYIKIQWVQIPAVTQTCDVDFQTCVNQHRIVLTATVNCGYEGYFSILYQNITDEQWWAATFRDAVNANCAQYAGVVYGIEN